MVLEPEFSVGTMQQVIRAALEVQFVQPTVSYNWVIGSRWFWPGVILAEHVNLLLTGFFGKEWGVLTWVFIVNSMAPVSNAHDLLLWATRQTVKENVDLEYHHHRKNIQVNDSQ